MSSFVVNSDVYARMAGFFSAFTKIERYAGSPVFRFYDPETGSVYGPEEVARKFVELQKLNIKATCHRYPDDSQEEYKAGFKKSDRAEFEKVFTFVYNCYATSSYDKLSELFARVLSALNCVHYQICESDELENEYNSLMNRFIAEFCTTYALFIHPQGGWSDIQINDLK